MNLKELIKQNKILQSYYNDVYDTVDINILKGAYFGTSVVLDFLYKLLDELCDEQLDIIQNDGLWDDTRDAKLIASFIARLRKLINKFEDEL